MSGKRQRLIFMFVASRMTRLLLGVLHAESIAAAHTCMHGPRLRCVYSVDRQTLKAVSTQRLWLEQWTRSMWR